MGPQFRLNRPTVQACSDANDAVTLTRSDSSPPAREQALTDECVRIPALYDPYQRIAEKRSSSRVRWVGLTGHLAQPKIKAVERRIPEVQRWPTPKPPDGRQATPHGWAYVQR